MLNIPAVNITELITLFVTVYDLTDTENIRCAKAKNHKITVFHLFAKTPQIGDLTR